MHGPQVPGARRDGRGPGPLRRAGAAAADGGDAGGQRLVHLGGRQEVHVHVDRARGEDPALARDDVGGRADHEVRVDAVGDVGVAGPAERDDPAVAEPDVGLDDAPVVEDHGVGDDRVGRALGPRQRGLGHRLPDRLASAEDGLLAAEGQVLLDLDPQVGVAEPDLVPDGGAVERGVLAAGELSHRPAPGPDDLEAGHQAPTAQRHDRHLAGGAGLEPPRRARRDVEPEAPGRLPVELERGVGVGQVQVRADLHGPVAGVDDDERAALVGGAVGVDLQVAVGQAERARSLVRRRARWGRGCVTSLRPSGKVASTCTSCSSSATSGSTWSAVSTCRPASISSATPTPSRARSMTQVLSRATVSGWLSRTPRSSRSRATIPATASSSFSVSPGVRCMA